MDVHETLRILSDAAKYDASCASSGSIHARPEGGLGNTEGMGICHSYTPDGRCVSLLKILLTNYCIFDCQFCINRVSSNTPRARFKPEQVVWLTMEFYKRNYIEGLFLSSGIIRSPDYTMEELVRVARSLREDHAFGGYIHLKAIPGAADDLIREAGLWADRLSANIELATQADLDALAPAKTQRVIETAMNTIHGRSKEEARPRKRRFAPAGQTTQMIVGATPTTDSEILSKSADLYKKHRLRRVYYSAFSPIQDASIRLPLKPAPLIRENRLYQADWLMRFYGFKHTEIIDQASANLDLDIDPKLAWALRNRDFFPVDVNKASKAALLRVPGLGRRTVDRILKARGIRAVSCEDLKRLRVPFDRVKYFIAAADPNPWLKRLDSLDLKAHIRGAQQLSLFPNDVQSSVNGEL